MLNKISRIKALCSIYFVSAIDNMGYGIVIALFAPLILSSQYHIIPDHLNVAKKMVILGSLYASFPIAQFFGAPFLGDLADHYGRRRIFFITISAAILGYFFTGFALSLKNIYMLFCTRFFSGFFAGNISLCTASIADLSPDSKQRARNFGILTVMWGLSFPIAILLGGYLSDPAISKQFSPALPFHILGLMTLLSLLTIYLFYPETFKKSKQDIKINLVKGFHNVIFALKKNHERKYFFLLYFWTLGWYLSIAWYGAYIIQKFGASQQTLTIGLLFQGFFWTLGGAVINPLLLKKWETQTIAKLVFSITAALLLLSSFMDQWIYFTAIYAIAAIFGAIGLSSTFNLISTSFPATTQGKAMGVGQSMMSMGAFCVPILGAGLGSITVSLFYPAAALFVFIGLCILLKK